MEIITAQHTLVQKILPLQKVADKSYRPMLYTLNYDVDGGKLLYNVLTGELVLLAADEVNCFLEQEYSDNATVNTLIEKWYLVPTDFDEETLYNQVNPFAEMMTDKTNNGPLTRYTIYPTTDCNARCFYCFELKQSHKPMTPQIASDVGDFIVRKCEGQPVRFRWFGGEPLYNAEAIDIICEKLSQAGVDFDGRMISNGYLFDDENVKKAKEKWHLDNVQITLDGTEEIYNRVKNFIYPNVNAFQRVLDNTERLLKAGISVSLRMNMDMHNADDLYKLTDLLYERFGQYKIFRPYVHLLFEDDSALHTQRTDAERHLLQERFFAFEDYLYEKFGLYLQGIENMKRFKHCMADSNRSTTVLPDGNLGKCEHYLDDHFWGNIYSDEIDRDVINTFKKKRNLGEMCRKCPLRPGCFELEMCQDVPNRCDEFDKQLLFRNVEGRIRSEYRLYLKRKN